jgi:hypothetical protein
MRTFLGSQTGRKWEMENAVEENSRIRRERETRIKLKIDAKCNERKRKITV